MLLLSPLTRWLTSLYDWRVAMLVLGDLAWVVTIPVALLIRNAPGEMGTVAMGGAAARQRDFSTDRKSTRLNSSHDQISYAVFCLKKKTHARELHAGPLGRHPLPLERHV